MEVHLNIIGILLIVLALMHIRLPKYFQWTRELHTISLITRQILYVHTFFIAFVILLMGVLCLTSAHDLHTNSLGKRLSFGLFIFWFVRLLFQFFVYSPGTWLGKRFETMVHIIFSVMWIYFSSVFFFAWWY